SQSVQIMIDPKAPESNRDQIRRQINEVWNELNTEAREEFSAEGHDANEVIFEPFAMMRYTGQLEDVEVPAPMLKLESDEDLNTLTEAFETLYETMNRSVSRYGEIGFTIMELGITARVEKVKPSLVRRPLQSEEHHADASKGTRPMYYNREWHEAKIWEMDYLEPGNLLKGPAIIEHPATTLVIPKGDYVYFDEWTILHYEHGEES